MAIVVVGLAVVERKSQVTPMSLGGCRRIDWRSVAVWLVSLGLVAVVLYAIWGSVVAWRRVGEVRMSVHGYVAMALAFVFTLLFTAGFLWLAYFSAWRGFDDAQGEARDNDWR